MKLRGDLMSKNSMKDLKAHIKALKEINHALLKDQMQDVKLNYAWAGSLGHWYWDYATNIVTFNPLKVLALGYKPEDIKEEVDYQFFTSKLHPDDYERVMANMIEHLKGISPAYEVEYRIKTITGDYIWYYDRGVVTKRDKDGKPLFLSGIVFDISEKKKYQEELEEKNRILSEQSSKDSLTMLYNHRSLYENLNNYIANIKKYSPLVIAMLDIDDFKQINDTKGHVFGDSVLKELSSVMIHYARKNDFVARYGGEEFFIAFPNSTLEEAFEVCENIRITFAKNMRTKDTKVTVSIGLSQYTEGNASSFIHQADINLYASKRNGKNKTTR